MFSLKFSVLIAVYIKDNPIFFRESLDSIFNQTLLPDEVVLVADGPLTSILDIIIKDYSDTHKELKVVRLLKNNGLGTALNEGLKQCSFDIVARMDSDDICKSDRFEKQIEVLKTHKEYDLVGSWIDEFFDNPKTITSVRKVPEMPGEIYRYCKSRCPVNHPTVMYRKKAVLDSYGYLTAYFPEDYFLWIRMLMNGCHFYNLQESLLFFRCSRETFKRRGGWKYAIDEVHIQKQIYDMGFINVYNLIYNIFVRFITRLLPNSIRSWIYTSLLRTKVSVILLSFSITISGLL